MGQSEAKERLEHISTQLQHTRTKAQVKPTHSMNDFKIHMHKKNTFYAVNKLKCVFLLFYF